MGPTYHHGLDVALESSPELGADLCLGLAHLVDAAADGDDALHVERVDLVDRGNGDLRLSVFHDALDRRALKRNKSDQISFCTGY